MTKSDLVKSKDLEPTKTCYLFRTQTCGHNIPPAELITEVHFCIATKVDRRKLP
jgi:hypothetical protein